MFGIVAIVAIVAIVFVIVPPQPKGYVPDFFEKPPVIHRKEGKPRS